MALQLNDPVAWLSIFRQHLDEIFDQILDKKVDWGGHFEFSPQLDVYETSDFHVIEIDLPGFAENDFSVRIAGITIRIEGVKRQDKIDDCMSYLCLERHFGRFCRTLEIPSAFDPNGFDKKYERGVLTLAFPRIKGAKDGY